MLSESVLRSVHTACEQGPVPRSQLMQILDGLYPSQSRISQAIRSLGLSDVPDAEYGLEHVLAIAERVHDLAPPDQIQLSSQDLVRCRKVFAAFDRDNSGSVSLAELRDVLNAVGIRLPEEEIARIIEQVDDTRNGEIEFDEFALLFGRFLPTPGDDTRGSGTELLQKSGLLEAYRDILLKLHEVPSRDPLMFAARHFQKLAQTSQKKEPGSGGLRPWRFR